MPKISIVGNMNMIISYQDDYSEPGYSAKFLWKDITKRVQVDSDIKNKEIGNYRIKYYLNYGPLRIKQIRNVKIIDDVMPEINAQDEIKICPNKEVEDIEYEAIDEYDGDITNNVIKDIMDDKIILRVKDSSDNENVKEVKVTRIDEEKPKITLKGDSTIYLVSGSSYNEPGYSANDNCDGDITSKVKVTGSVGSGVGTYKLIYSVSDNADNNSEVTRTVIVYKRVSYNGGNNQPGTIYLTFDDGPSWGTTNVILDILKEEGVKATFFVTCNGPDALIKRMYDEGHTVALHTATHNYQLIYSSVDAYFSDLNTVSSRVERITGIRSLIIRFPGGSSNTVSKRYRLGIMSELTNLVVSRGYHYFDWNVDSNDAGGAGSSQAVYNNVVNNLSKNRANMVLMHDTKTTTRDALRNIIRYGYSQGYSFSKIDMNTYMIRHGVNN